MSTVVIAPSRVARCKTSENESKIAICEENKTRNKKTREDTKSPPKWERTAFAHFHSVDLQNSSDRI
uniref:Uncharacterized protein n=1 Tax=Steinernema glaseri TaxID=37863 RepID=A0A1I7ZUY0_9BILA